MHELYISNYWSTRVSRRNQWVWQVMVQHWLSWMEPGPRPGVSLLRTHGYTLSDRSVCLPVPIETWQNALCHWWSALVHLCPGSARHREKEWVRHQNTTHKRLCLNVGICGPRSGLAGEEPRHCGSKSRSPCLVILSTENDNDTPTLNGHSVISLPNDLLVTNNE